MLLKPLIDTVGIELSLSEADALRLFFKVEEVSRNGIFTRRLLTSNDLNQKEVSTFLKVTQEHKMVIGKIHYDCLAHGTSGLVESINELCEVCGKTLFTGINDGSHEIEEIFEIMTEFTDELRKLEEEALFTYIHRDFLQNFRSLKESRNRIIPFLGAGMAIPFGLPTWRGLFEGLAKDINRNNEKRFLDFVAEGKYFEAVKYLKSYSASLATDSQIKEEVSLRLKRLLNTGVDLNLHNYEELKLFNPRFYLTTNYDTSLSKYLNGTPLCLNDIENFQKLYNEDEHRVVHIHGIWDRPDKMILTQEDYDALYNDDSFTHRFAALMGTYKLLFIGFSFNDDYFREMYGHLLKFLGGEHYIVVANPESYDIKAYAKLNLKIIGINVRTVNSKLESKSLTQSIRGIFNYLQK